MHTTHCSPNGEILISGMGDPDGNGKGDFLIIDEGSLQIKGLLYDFSTISQFASK